MHFCNLHVLSATGHRVNLSRRTQCVHTASEECEPRNALHTVCNHGAAVNTADKAHKIASATPVFRGEAEFESALERLRKGSLNEKMLTRIRNRLKDANDEGVPLLARVGDTGWFVVRDGSRYNRTVIGEWAHVKVSRKGSGVAIQCKVRGVNDCRLTVVQI